MGGLFRAWKCPRCGRLAWREAALCGRCGAGGLEARDLSGRGTLYSYTRVHVSSPRFREETPYLLALVDLAEGDRVIGRLSGGVPPEPPLGAAVELVARGSRGRSTDSGLTFRVMG